MPRRRRGPGETSRPSSRPSSSVPFPNRALAAGRVRFDDYGYGEVASFYEELADLYSRGRIAASKRSQLVHLAPGDRVLYVGVGRGEDALEAARKGVRVTAVPVRIEGSAPARCLPSAAC